MIDIVVQAFGYKLQMLRMDCLLSNLKSTGHYSSESIYPMSPFSTSQHLSHFTFLSAFPTTIMLLLALLVLKPTTLTRMSQSLFFSFWRCLFFQLSDIHKCSAFYSSSIKLQRKGFMCLEGFVSTEVLILQQLRQKAPVLYFDRDACV